MREQGFDLSMALGPSQTSTLFMSEVQKSGGYVSLWSPLGQTYIQACGIITKLSIPDLSQSGTL